MSPPTATMLPETTQIKSLLLHRHDGERRGAQGRLSGLLGDTVTDDKTA